MVRNYKCPGCGAAMEFDSVSQKMHCSHCDTFLSVEELDALYKDTDQNNSEQVNTSGEFTNRDETQNFQVYKCPSCGAEVLCDAHTAATFCSFCGNPTILKDRVEGLKTPDAIIPFKISKEQAVEMYKAWTKKGLFTPSLFRSRTVIEKITGIYVPFWIYDYDAEADITAHCTRVHHERRGNTEYIHTDNFRVTRDVCADYLKVPADASEKMPDDVMDMMEPFNYEEMTKFEMPYLSGFYAEKYNYDRDQLAPRVEKRVGEYIVDAARSSIVGYSTVNIINSQTNLIRNDAHYTMFPVWVLNYRYMDKDYSFTLNGQTGKIVGYLPVSKAKAFGFFAVATAVLFGVFTLIGGIFG